MLVSTSYSHLVPNGGMALGAFLTLFDSRRLLTEFRRLIVAHEADDTVIVDVGFMDRVAVTWDLDHGFMIAQSHSAEFDVTKQAHVGLGASNCSMPLLSCFES